MSPRRASTAAPASAVSIQSPAAPVGGGVVPAPRLRRRPVLVVLAVALVAAGALLGVVLWSSASTTVEVVAVRADVQRGALITAADLGTVRLTPDPALQVVPAAELPGLVGRRAATDLAAGSVLTAAQVTDVVVPAAGESVVGVALAPGMLPAEPLRAGDRVRLVQTPGPGGDVEGAVTAIDAVVVSVAQGDTQVVVNVVLPSSRAAELAARAATGRVALVLDSRAR